MRPLHHTSVNKGLSVLTSLCSWAIGHCCTTMPVWGSYTCSTCFCGSSPPYACLPVPLKALPSTATWTCSSRGLHHQPTRFLSTAAFGLLAHEPGRQGGIDLLTVQPG